MDKSKRLPLINYKIKPKLVFKCASTNEKVILAGDNIAKDNLVRNYLNHHPDFSFGKSKRASLTKSLVCNRTYFEVGIGEFAQYLCKFSGSPLL